MTSQLEFNRRFAVALAKSKLSPPAMFECLKRISKDTGIGLGNKFEVYTDPFGVMAFYNSKQKGLEKNKELVANLLIKEFDIDMDGPPSEHSNIPLVDRRYHFVDRDVKNRNDVVDKAWDCFRIFVSFSEGEEGVSEQDFIDSFDYFITIKGNKKNPHAQLTYGLFWINSEKYCSFDSHIQSYLLKAGVVDNFKKVDGKKYLQICKKVFDYLEKNGKTLDEISGLAYKKTFSIEKEGKGVTHIMPSKYKLNTILYGPPGTGKTYEARKRAIEIVTGNIPKDEEIDSEFQRLVEEKRISFVTFHQSFGYEQFIEGYRPVTSQDDPSITGMEYRREDGIFKEFCESAIPNTGAIKTIIDADVQIWKMSLGEKFRKDIHDDCLSNDYIRLGYDTEVKDLNMVNKVYDKNAPNSVNAFFGYMEEGDIVIIRSSPTEFDAVARVTGPCIIRNDFEDYCQVRSVEWLYRGKPVSLKKIPNSKKLMQTTLYRIDWMDGLDVSRLIDSGTESGDDKYVFIIDEINRGNVSRIFGETMTLIEESKRSKVGDGQNKNSVKLSYSKEDFSIPENVFVIGTMNTADRSLVSLDTALRRRFSFERMMPKPDLLPKYSSINSVDLKSLLETLNNRIEVLYDKEHLIGHSYFMGINDIEQLRIVFTNEIIPLLEEYFHNDYSKIINVLSKKGEPNDSEFIYVEQGDVFSESELNINTRYGYSEKNEDDKEFEKAIRSIYE